MMETVDIPKVTDAEIAFGTTKHLPEEKDIPKEFTDETSTWNTLFDKLFYGHKDSDKIEMYPKIGVNPVAAMRLIKAHMVSFEPKHEHKRAACSYLFSKYFDSWGYSKG
jgi:anaerobic selenocysteine-containing dehydrogenase